MNSTPNTNEDIVEASRQRLIQTGRQMGEQLQRHDDFMADNKRRLDEVTK